MDQTNHSAQSMFRGTLYIIGGVLLLLHILGWLQKGIDTIMIFVALGLIVYGIFISGLYHKAASLLQKK